MFENKGKQAYVLQKKYDRAIGLFSAAYGLNPHNIQYKAQRGITKVLNAKFQEGINDLSPVLAKRPAHIEALLFRSIAHRQLNNTKAAKRDLGLAYQLEPTNAHVLLEKGLEAALSGDAKRAREQWEDVIKYAPRTTLALVAHENIEKLPQK